MADTSFEPDPYAYPHPDGSWGHGPEPPALVCWRCRKTSPAGSIQCPYCQAVFEPADSPVRGYEQVPVDPSPATALLICWRCQKGNESEVTICKFCRALLSTEPKDGNERFQSARQEEADHRALLAVVLHYSLALILLLIHGWVLHFGVRGVGKNDEEIFKEALPTLLVTDSIFALLSIVAFFHVRRDARQPRGYYPLAAWLYGPLMLAVLLGLNYAYHSWVRQQFGLRELRLPFWGSDLWPWTILSYCIQPAIFEELFFRQAVLGTFRRHMSTHAAVWISALIFALFHLGAIISIPILVLAGALLGYTRVATGSLILPMLLHFTHNLVVVMLS